MPGRRARKGGQGVSRERSGDGRRALPCPGPATHCQAPPTASRTYPPLPNPSGLAPPASTALRCAAPHCITLTQQEPVVAAVHVGDGGHQVLKVVCPPEGALLDHVQGGGPAGVVRREVLALLQGGEGGSMKLKESRGAGVPGSSRGRRGGPAPRRMLAMSERCSVGQGNAQASPAQRSPAPSPTSRRRPMVSASTPNRNRLSWPAAGGGQHTTHFSHGVARAGKRQPDTASGTTQHKNKPRPPPPTTFIPRPTRPLTHTYPTTSHPATASHPATPHSEPTAPTPHPPVFSAISTFAPSRVPMMSDPLSANFMLLVPLASVPAVEMCWLQQCSRGGGGEGQGKARG